MTVRDKVTKLSNKSVPNDLSYVYSGYAPLSVRLAQFLALPGWRAISEALALLPGPTLTDLQQRPTAGRMPRRACYLSHGPSGRTPFIRDTHMFLFLYTRCLC
ncbi:hypothetical protein HPB51_024815 [Rhipicephalus microplus]|uniref:Uncharacterized protein n=1 Tax=Rhipicephalus microplus TaxID=6941 RepID=A0A9J6F6F4_RHIMP|nr:hypothetical protein HPB51_024815 [Rhipicephalus microplus]